MDRSQEELLRALHKALDQFVAEDETLSATDLPALFTLEAIYRAQDALVHGKSASRPCAEIEQTGALKPRRRRWRY